VGFPFRESERRIVTASGVTRRNEGEGHARTNKKPRHSVNGRGLANFLAEAVSASAPLFAMVPWLFVEKVPEKVPEEVISVLVPADLWS